MELKDAERWRELVMLSKKLISSDAKTGKKESNEYDVMVLAVDAELTRLRKDVELLTKKATDGESLVNRYHAEVERLTADLRTVCEGYVIPSGTPKAYRIVDRVLSQGEAEESAGGCP